MSPKLQPVRGTHDILPEEARKRRFIVDKLRGVAELFGYGEIETPIFEFSEVFHRTLGDTSDVVTKETYTFTDRGGESLTLRPEFTASVVRAFISAGLTQDLPQKFFYHGPAFRYERPQKGRLRQFHQFGAELLGEPDPAGDVEMIAMAFTGLTELGLSWGTDPALSSDFILDLNSLGDTESRHNYRAALVSYFNDHRHNLSEDSRTRLDKNPLRILDSKDEGDKKLVTSAPAAVDYFTSHAKEFFAQVKELLSARKIAYRLNPRLVRGLDYYSHTVFEFVTNRLGSQGTILAGGRYDGLVKLMGGNDVPGVGFAAGIERLCELKDVIGFTIPKKIFRQIVAIIPVDEMQEKEAHRLAQELIFQLPREIKDKNFSIELITRGNVGKRMKRADKIGASFAVMLGEDEMKAHSVALKNLATGEQKIVPQSELITILGH